MYSDNHRKFAIVLNKKHPVATLLNAMGHVTAGLVAKVGADEPDFLDYRCPAGEFSSLISRFPVIVLSGGNSNQLRRLTDESSAAGLVANTFVTAMLGASAEEQLAQTEQAAAEELEYLAVAVFGDAAVIDPLTKRFSLWK